MTSKRVEQHASSRQAAVYRAQAPPREVNERALLRIARMSADDRSWRKADLPCPRSNFGHQRTVRIW